LKTINKGDEPKMRNILLLALASVLWVGSAGAQQTTGKAAEDARAQVMQFEKDKVPLMLKGGSAFADWLDKMDAEDSIFINEDGSRRSKVQQLEIWQTGNKKQSANNQHDHQVFVYDNGNVAIVTYIGPTTETVNGKIITSNIRCADTWVKQNGKWMRVVHANTRILETSPYSKNP
jgi:hypothetical protein